MGSAQSAFKQAHTFNYSYFSVVVSSPNWGRLAPYSSAFLEKIRNKELFLHFPALLLSKDLRMQHSAYWLQFSPSAFKSDGFSFISVYKSQNVKAELCTLGLLRSSSIAHYLLRPFFHDA
ncbi:hypothetical protein PEDI_20000 [Persicobacter diffluens]|uniref:Uncharacterized protein n=1 Tax=Persicobacter diffluens TaxID=981 RepID=A0AAN4VXC7_9BACT|nr:hypothetical protein PEDI_20000 [Persicobacter diffluens]